MYMQPKSSDSFDIDKMTSLFYTLLIRMLRNGKGTPTPVLLPGKSYGWESLVGCSPRGRWGSDTTEQFHFHFSLSWIGEGNGNPLQCSCLENPRDGGAWWAAVYGVAQSQTRLEWISSNQIRSDHISCSVVSDSVWLHESQHDRSPCPSPTPEFTQTHIHLVSDAI